MENFRLQQDAKRKYKSKEIALWMKLKKKQNEMAKKGHQ